MIVVIEGPSAAGKTSWVRRYQPDVAVWERRPAHSSRPGVIGAILAMAEGVTA